METKKADRRVKYTKMVIKESFVALLKEKPVSKITIKEICEGADVNRATFYAHYADQYDLLRKIEEELIFDVHQYITGDCISPSPATKDMLTKIFSYIRKNAEICRVLLGDHGDNYFQEMLTQLVRQQFISEWTAQKSVSQDDAEYIYTFILTGCVGVIKKWLSQGMQKSDESFAELIIRFADKGSSAF